MAAIKKQPEGSVTIENFFGVYLLYCTNPKYKGRTYIGFTVDPNRRINQHNVGKKAGGAWRTSNRGPWEMVLIVHGFLDDIAALKFEWAWQHPGRSRHLTASSTTSKKTGETAYLYNLKVLAEMLSVGPWNRLPLSIQWLVPSYEKPFPAHKPPPLHMSICYGPICAIKISASTSSNEEENCTKMCWVCMDDANPSELLACIRPKCSLVAHTTCLAKRFLGNEKDEILPVEGSCPRCKSKILWGDLIRKKKGCYVELESNNDDVEESLCSM